ncbi:ras-GEF domain-containing family member 1B-like isoform X2 [Biomphalaria glabrata]|nr:ras-GEF domain-containing family member 1B-like isoform X2 [Biomphalaria glabrata]
MPYASDDSMSSSSASSLELSHSHDDTLSSTDSFCNSEDGDCHHVQLRNHHHQHHYRQHSICSSVHSHRDTIGYKESVEAVELSSIQMEVTTRLLEGEKKRLLLLKHNLELCLSHVEASKAEIEMLKENIVRIEQKCKHLDEEYRVGCKEALVRRINMGSKSSRSQPAIGVKQTAKQRPTIFGTVTQPQCVQPKTKNRESIGAQMLSLAQMFGSGSGYMGTDNNNHTEKDCERDALIFENGNLHSGPLEALIQHLVPTSDYYPDRTYTFAFLLSSRLFIRPHDLLAEVLKLCVLQQNLTHDNVDKVKLGKFGPHIVNLLSEWTETFPYDFRDERMMKQLRDITQRVIAIYPDLRKEINNLSYNLVTKLTNLKSYEESLNRIETEERQKAQTQLVASTDIMELCPSPLVLAQQLTHIELERLSMIGPEEFVQAFTKERLQSEMLNIQDMKITHNLESYVQWFNRLSYLVASEITSQIKKKNRIKMVEYFIDVAKECINIGNFNSLMAIIAGMNLSPVTRLKKTWAKVNRDKLKILEHQMDPSNNFGSYRSCLKAAMWRSEGAAEEREKIVIPFFSLFVKDLYFLNEGCSSRQEDGSVNFQKCWQMAKQISDLISWQQVECPFERNKVLINYLLTTPIYKETMLSLASYECETAETSYDRERYKQIKSQTSL